MITFVFEVIPFLKVTDLGVSNLSLEVLSEALLLLKDTSVSSSVVSSVTLRTAVPASRGRFTHPANCCRFLLPLLDRC